MTLRCKAGGRRGPATGTLACALGVALAAAAPGASASSLRVSPGGGASFPNRSLVLSLQKAGALPSASVHVSENGKPVGGVVVTPIKRAAAGDFGVVLAIDVSPSMKGAPLAQAMAAARALAAERTGMQELGVVTFDQSAKVALSLTDDPHAIDSALAHVPAVGRGAYIYNALTTALGQLEKAKIAAGAVILLSDGASRGAVPRAGHRVTASAIGAAAAAAHVQIYTVGLRDRAYTPQRMTLLARVGGGAFVEASSRSLAHVFRQIETGLTSAYVLHYRSAAALGQHVNVTVAVDGVSQGDTLSYDAPPAPPAAPGPPHPHAKAKSFWVSTAALVIFSLLAAMLLAFALFALLVPRLRREQLRRRVGKFTATGVLEAPPREQEASEGIGVLPTLERILERLSWWERFKTNVSIARIERTPVELVAYTALVSILTAIIFPLLLGAGWIAVIPLVAGPLLLHGFVKYQLRRQRELFSEQLPVHLQELASAMRAGHSLVSGLTSIAREAPEPSRGEWAQVVADEQLGVPLEDAMQPLAVRMDSEDIRQVELVATLHHRTGGNMAEVLERVADSVRDRAELRRELHALTAQARLSRYIVTALPPVVTLFVWLINPGYIRPLFHSSTGVVLLVVAVGLLTGASLIMRKITDVKV